MPAMNEFLMILLVATFTYMFAYQRGWQRGVEHGRRGGSYTHS